MRFGWFFWQSSRRTGSEVVAEGVENERELAVLLELGVQKAQGYFPGYPGALPA